MLVKLITPENVIFSAVLAFFITYGLMRAADLIKMYRENRLIMTSVNIKEALIKCYILFPIENCTISDFFLERGMTVRITTRQNKIFEGEFLGANDNDMLCLMTRKFIIAHSIENIERVERIDR